jgi:hypothetical protein
MILRSEFILYFPCHVKNVFLTTLIQSVDSHIKLGQFNVAILMFKKYSIQYISYFEFIIKLFFIRKCVSNA